jgi:hypothetical protein
MTRAIPVTALALFLAGSALVAHHPFAAEYDWKKPVTVTGKVTRFEWKNPHSLLEVSGKDESGRNGQWTVELGGPAQLQRLGWKTGQLKNGDEVTVDGWLAKSGGTKLSAKSVTPAGGRELFAASSFFETTPPVAAKRTTTATQGTSGKKTPAPTSTSQH